MRTYGEASVTQQTAAVRLITQRHRHAVMRSADRRQTRLVEIGQNLSEGVSDI